MPRARIHEAEEEMWKGSVVILGRVWLYILELQLIV